MWRQGTMLVLGLVLAASGCQAPQRAATAEPGERDRALSEGYALLHGLLDQNRRVDQAPRIPFRSVSDETADLLERIARACADGAQRVRRAAEGSARIGLDEDGLPAVERATRDAIAATNRRELLGGDRAMFELNLLLSQAEATRYASHLARALAARENDSRRRAMLEQLAETFEALRVEVVARLIDH